MTPFRGKQQVTSAYGYRIIEGRKEHHNGMDVAIRSGDWTIREVTGGKCIETSIGYNGGRGNLVKIETAPGVVEWYQHLSQIFVKKGQDVPQGTHIGVAGATGYSIGVHLHFEVQINGLAVNPEEWIGIKNEYNLLVDGNNDYDEKKPDVQPDPGPYVPPIYPQGKYRLYSVSSAFESEEAAIKEFTKLKPDAKVEYILAAVAGKWRIMQVILATENLDLALANFKEDMLVCGSDYTKFRIYSIRIAKENRDIAVAQYQQIAISAPNDIVITNIGGDNKYRLGFSEFAYESLDSALAQLTVDKILC